MLEERLKQHILVTGANSCNEWIRSVTDKGHKIKICLLKSNAVWGVTEKEQIKKYIELGYNLVNSTSGGQGAFTANRKNCRKHYQALLTAYYRKNFLSEKDSCSRQRRKEKSEWQTKLKVWRKNHQPYIA